MKCNVVNTREECGECFYMMQGKSCCVCGHPEANMDEDGNGRYVYWNWDCDIDKFKDWDGKMSREEQAKINGWVLGKDKKNVIWPYWEKP